MFRLIQYERVDPATDTAWASCPIFTAQDVPQVVETAHVAFEKFAKTSPRQRADWITKWDSLIKENKIDIAKILTHEAGKPIREAEMEVDFSAASLLWYAGEAERIEGTVATSSFPPGEDHLLSNNPLALRLVYYHGTSQSPCYCEKSAQRSPLDAR